MRLVCFKFKALLWVQSTYEKMGGGRDSIPRPSDYKSVPFLSTILPHFWSVSFVPKTKRLLLDISILATTLCVREKNFLMICFWLIFLQRWLKLHLRDMRCDAALVKKWTFAVGWMKREKKTFLWGLVLHKSCFPCSVMLLLHLNGATLGNLVLQKLN